MEPFIPQERPNTVSGLNAKREELVLYRKALHAEVRKVTCDVDHLEGCNRLFDPDTAPPPSGATSSSTGRRRDRCAGSSCACCARCPARSRPEIAEAWVADRGLRCDDQTTVVSRRRMGAALTALRNQNVVRQEGMIDGLKGWLRT
jgi:hypothetical protein